MFKSAIFGSISLIALVAANPVLAQTAADAETSSTTSDSPDIVVTAEKRGTTQQRTAATVQVVSGEQLVEKGVTSLTSLTKETTGVVFVPTRQLVQIFSRGLGQPDSQTQTTPAVEVDFDGAGLPKSAQQFAFFDLGNIQILKGPQGILYGRNAIGGAVIVSSKRPTFDAFKVEGSLEAGNYALIHPSAGVNVPLSANTAIRAAVDYQDHSAYLSNGANALNQLSSRMSLLSEPVDGLTIFASATYSRRKGNGFAYSISPLANAANGDAWFIAPTPTSGTFGVINFSNPINSGGYDHSTGLLLNGEITYKITPHLTLSYVPTYFRYRSQQINRWGILVRNPATGQDVAGGNTVNYFVENSNDVSHEARLTYADSALDIVGGVMYHSYEVPGLTYQTAYPSGPYVNGPVTTTEKNFGVFADAKVAILPTVRLEVGGRYSRDLKGAYGSLSGSTVDLNSSTFPAFTNFSWKVGIEADVAPRVMAYASVQTGYLPGAYQSATQTTLNNLGLGRRYESETVTAYTAGVKSRLFGDLLQLNAEAFYYNYDNFQVNQRIGLLVGGVQSFQAVYSNVAKSRIYGLDADVKLHPYTAGRFSLGLSLLNAKIVRTGFTSLGVFQPTGGYALAADPSLSGYDLPYSPRVTLNMGYEHTVQLADGADIVANVSTHHESSRWLDFTHPNLPSALQGASWKTDASLTYHAPDDRWSIAIWGRNLENTATYSNVAPQALRVNGSSSNPIIGYYTTSTVDAPRTFGIRFGFNY